MFSLLGLAMLTVSWDPYVDSENPDFATASSLYHLEMIVTEDGAQVLSSPGIPITDTQIVVDGISEGVFANVQLRACRETLCSDWAEKGKQIAKKPAKPVGLNFSKQ